MEITVAIIRFVPGRHALPNFINFALRFRPSLMPVFSNHIPSHDEAVIRQCLMTRIKHIFQTYYMMQDLVCDNLIKFR